MIWARFTASGPGPFVIMKGKLNSYSLGRHPTDVLKQSGDTEASRILLLNIMQSGVCESCLTFFLQHYGRLMDVLNDRQTYM